MAWNMIRTADDTDHSRLTAAAIRFARRHNIPNIETVQDIECYIDGIRFGRDIDNHPRMLRLWHACAARALRARGAQGIAYGSVGYTAQD